MAADTQPKYTVAIAVDQSEYSRHAVEFYLEKIHSDKFELALISILEPIYATSFVPASGYAMGSIYCDFLHEEDKHVLLIHIAEPFYISSAVTVAAGFSQGSLPILYCNFVHKPEYKLLVLHTATQMYQTALTAAAGSLSQGNAMAALPASHWTQMAQEQKEKVRQLKHKYDPLFEEKSVQRHWRVIETTASPGEAIVASAEDAGACLIVVGSRGQGALRRTILGSVSDYVLHHAKVPVMISHGDH